MLLLIACSTGRDADPLGGSLSVEQNAARGSQAVELKWQPVPLDSAALRRVRQILQTARARDIREEAEAERGGQVTGGVPGCISPDYRMTFRSAENSWSGILHLDCGWFQGNQLAGSFRLSSQEVNSLRLLLQASAWPAAA
jgi:hypothetical protein